MVHWTTTCDEPFVAGRTLTYLCMQADRRTFRRYLDCGLRGNSAVPSEIRARQFESALPDASEYPVHRVRRKTVRL